MRPEGTFRRFSTLMNMTRSNSDTTVATSPTPTQGAGWQISLLTDSGFRHGFCSSFHAVAQPGNERSSLVDNFLAQLHAHAGASPFGIGIGKRLGTEHTAHNF